MRLFVETTSDSIVYFISKSQDRKVYLHDWDGNALRQTAILTANLSIVTALAFSPDGTLLAVGDVSGSKVHSLFALTRGVSLAARYIFSTSRRGRHVMFTVARVNSTDSY